MKSSQVSRHDSEHKNSYTPLQVLSSAAGFYIGTLYNNPDGYQEPGSRDSGYFNSFQQAEDMLESWKRNENLLSMREHP